MLGILIVDRSASVGARLARHLSATGRTTHVVSSAAAAIRSLGEHLDRLSLLIIEDLFADGDNLFVAIEQHASWQRLPIIVTTNRPATLFVEALTAAQVHVLDRTAWLVDAVSATDAAARSVLLDKCLTEALATPPGGSGVVHG